MLRWAVMVCMMRWIRTHRRAGAWVAQFALALQLVLSFGHVHAENLALPSAAASASVQAPGSGTDGAAPDRDHGGSAGAFCAICATLNLASSSVLPALSFLVLPPIPAVAWLVDYCTAPIPLALHFIFRARAPPALS
jgi:hypothetical protein